VRKLEPYHRIQGQNRTDHWRGERHGACDRSGVCKSWRESRRGSRCCRRKVNADLPRTSRYAHDPQPRAAMGGRTIPKVFSIANLPVTSPLAGWALPRKSPISCSFCAPSSPATSWVRHRCRTADALRAWVQLLLDPLRHLAMVFEADETERTSGLMRASVTLMLGEHSKLLQRSPGRPERSIGPTKLSRNYQFTLSPI
jgi:hypothetical protein